MSSLRASLPYLAVAGLGLAWAQTPPSDHRQPTPVGNPVTVPAPGAGPISQPGAPVVQPTPGGTSEAMARPAESHARVAFNTGDLVEIDSEVAVRIPLTMNEGKQGPAIELRGFQYDGVFSPPPLESIKARLAASANAPAGAYEIIVNGMADALPPGTYQVLIELRADPAAGVQPILLALGRPAPALTAEGAVAVWSTIPMWSTIAFWSPGGPNAMGPAAFDLKLREIGRKARARAIAFTEVRDDAQTFRLRGGRFSFPPASDMAADTVRPHRVALTGAFPPGIATGKIVIRAANLREPVEVAYSVNVRRSLGWIAVLGVLGGFAGWYVRVRLQAQQVLYQAAAEAAKLMAVLNAEARVADEDYRKEINAARNELRRDANSSSPEAIRAAIAEAQRKLTAASQNLTASLQKLAQELEPQYELLTAPWTLPAAVDDQLAAGRRAVAHALQLIEARDASGVRKALGDDVRTALAKLADTAGHWRENAGAYLEALCKSVPITTTNGATQLREAVTAWQKEYGAFREPGPITLAQLNKELTDINAAFAQAKRIVARLAAWGRDMVVWVREQLLVADDPSLHRLLTLLSTHAADYLVELNQPPAEAEKPKARVRAQREAWRAFLQAASAGAPLLPAVESDIEHGEWASSAEKVLEQRVKARVHLRAVDAAVGGPQGTPVVTGTAPLAGPIAQPVTESPRPIPIAAALLRPIGRIAGTATEERVFLEAARKAAALQSVCISLVFVAAAYALFADKWHGTWRDMFAVFAWAFILDLTADALTAVLRRVAPAAVS